MAALGSAGPSISPLNNIQQYDVTPLPPSGFTWGGSFTFDVDGRAVAAHESCHDDGAAFALPDAPSSACVHLVLTVDWEGTGFDAEDLAAFAQFRDDFPGVPLTHFLNAAYFSRLAPDDVLGAVSASDNIRTVLREGDEIGLHVHSDSHLMHAAGVAPRTVPSWNHMVPGQYHIGDETGHCVPLSMFSEEEVRRVVHFSCRTLEQQGFERPKAFRAGGWHAGSSVFSALAAEGFEVDSSEVPSDWFPPQTGPTGELHELWPDASRTTQPYRHESGIVEVPDNGCLADYVTSDEMVESFEAVVESSAGGEEAAAVLTFGFHQETAARFLPRVRRALAEIERRAAEAGIRLSYGRTCDVTHLAADVAPAEPPSPMVAEPSPLPIEGISAADAAKAAWLARTGTWGSVGGGKVLAPPATPESSAKAKWLARTTSKTGKVTVIPAGTSAGVDVSADLREEGSRFSEELARSRHSLLEQHATDARATWLKRTAK